MIFFFLSLYFSQLTGASRLAIAILRASLLESIFLLLIVKLKLKLTKKLKASRKENWFSSQQLVKQRQEI